MSGRRLLDTAALAKVARSIAKQHVRIRTEQAEAWSKTSTVAKAVKDQTDRVTVTAQAASELARRLNESAPRYDPFQGREQPIDTTASVRREGDEYGRQAESQPQEGVKQDVNQGREGQRTPGVQANQNADNEFRSATSSHGSEAAGFANKAQSHTAAARQESDDELPEGVNVDIFQSPRVSKSIGKKGKDSESRNDNRFQDFENALRRQKSSEATVRPEQSRTTPEGTWQTHEPPLENENSSPSSKVDQSTADLAAEIAKESEAVPSPSDQDASPNPTAQPNAYQMHESRVPSSRIGRIWQYSGLATSMAFGAVGETFKRATGTSDGGSLMLSAGNMERLVAKLSRMRGAALKLGQMLSFQDSKMLPPAINTVLQRVQDNADYMPPNQRNQVLRTNLGPDWRSLFSSFTEVPLAAASIGQVHRATLASTNTPVAVKIQYPGVSTSISSDLNNLSLLLTASRLLPKGLYLDKTIANARAELAWECDYEREAACQTRFRSLLKSESDTFTVPAVIPEASGAQVLTADFMHGTAVTKPELNLTQHERDWIGTQILRLCLRELTEFNFMQTDPNWTNFLYNRGTQKLELLDFGATREFPRSFVDPYVEVLIAAAKRDRQAVRDLSLQLGYLTGHEEPSMTDAHIDSVLTLAEPFAESKTVDQAYDFKDQSITERVRKLIPKMLAKRLVPPPEETYSLHRKLSGAFLLLARLGSRVPCRDMFLRAVEGWRERRGGLGEEGTGGGGGGGGKT
ncbi:MAG: hypothetical protein M1831_003082 [Alyxoria varia]|nr:MAG: hypothetical protein M1831_003082 [Alyxoria varia]